MQIRICAARWVHLSSGALLLTVRGNVLKYFPVRHAMPGKSLLVLHLVGGLLSLGCGSPAGPVDQPGDPCDVARETRPQPEFLTVPEEADIVARISPGGFGSLFQDFGPGSLIVYLQNLAKSDSARFVIRRLLNCGGAYPGWANQLIDPNSIQFREGKYTGSQLLSYLSALDQLKNDPAVWAMEVDPETNKIWIGLRSSGEIARVNLAVTAAGVPNDAVQIEVPPSATGFEPFQVLDSTVTTVLKVSTKVSAYGVFLADARVAYTNHFSETRYPDYCVTVDGSRVSFQYRIEKWDGQNWRNIHNPICLAIGLEPDPIQPGESRTDTIPFVGVRRLNAQPLWLTARITGYYRFVGKVYLSAIPGTRSLTNPAPEAQISTPFRILNSLRF